MCQQPCNDEIGDTVSGPVERRLKLEVYFDLPSCDGMMITDCCDMSCGVMGNCVLLKIMEFAH